MSVGGAVLLVLSALVVGFAAVVAVSLGVSPALVLADMIGVGIALAIARARSEETRLRKRLETRLGALHDNDKGGDHA